MNIHILYVIKDGPWGGGNQFLKNLRKYFQKKKIYVDTPEAADVILFNSHHDLFHALKMKRKYPSKVFVHRIDGPISLIRDNDRMVDRMIYFANDQIADGTIFQSGFSKKNNQTRGHHQTSPEVVIHNSADASIFFRKQRKKHRGKKKILAVSWAQHWNKGFAVYKYLDEHLDFSRFDLTFIGNSPLSFKNIRQKPPMNSSELADELRAADIFITASKKDPCSNAVIEALTCGTPVVALKDGGHPELIQNGGAFFTRKEDALKAIDRVAVNLAAYRKRIPVFDAPKEYETFMRTLKPIKKPTIQAYVSLAYMRLRLSYERHFNRSRDETRAAR